MHAMAPRIAAGDSENWQVLKNNENQPTNRQFGRDLWAESGDRTTKPACPGPHSGTRRDDSGPSWGGRGGNRRPLDLASVKRPPPRIPTRWDDPDFRAGTGYPASS